MSKPTLSDVEMHPITPADFDQIREIEQLSFENPWPMSTIKLMESERSTNWIVAGVERPFREFEILGAMCMGWSVDWYTLHRIAVHPSSRSRGIGSMLVEYLIRCAGDKFCVACIDVDDVVDDLMCEEFLKSMGFAEARRARNLVVMKRETEEV